jgi:hypothetical protein
MATIIVRSVPVLDQVAQGLAWGLGKVLPQVRGAGLFWVSPAPRAMGGHPFWDAWRDPHSWTLRLGRLELVVDLPERRPAASPT